MRRRIVLITHSLEEHQARDDRASDQLQKLGYTLDWKIPCEGDALDPIDEEVAGTIVLCLKRGD